MNVVLCTVPQHVVDVSFVVDHAVASVVALTVWMVGDLHLEFKHKWKHEIRQLYLEFCS